VIANNFANNNIRKVLGYIKLIDWYKVSILRKSFNNNEDAIVASIADKVFGL
jgi:hypothetical protein